MIDLMDRYFEGGWLKYAVAGMIGVVFGHFVPAAVAACAIFLPVAVGLIILGG